MTDPRSTPPSETPANARAVAEALRWLLREIDKPLTAGAGPYQSKYAEAYKNAMNVLAATLPEAPQPAIARSEPDLWWNGFRRYDERSGTYPSVAEHEDTNHDIPLYSGVNPCNAPLSEKQAGDATKVRKAEVAWLHKFINCTPFGEHAPQADIQRAHSIVALLAAAPSPDGN